MTAKNLLIAKKKLGGFLNMYIFCNNKFNDGQNKFMACAKIYLLITHTWILHSKICLLFATIRLWYAKIC
jgi:hypothetical protein